MNSVTSLYTEEQKLAGWANAFGDSSPGSHMKRLTSNELQIMENLRQLENQSALLHSKNASIIISRSPAMVVPKSLYTIKHKLALQKKQTGDIITPI